MMVMAQRDPTIAAVMMRLKSAKASLLKRSMKASTRMATMKRMIDMMMRRREEMMIVGSLKYKVDEGKG
jgi:hypothetical protein